MNVWLLVLSFVLGAGVTAVALLGRVRREVPVYEERKSAGAQMLDDAVPPRPDEPTER